MKSIRSGIFSFLCLTAITLLPANLLAGPPPGPGADGRYDCNETYYPTYSCNKAPFSYSNYNQTTQLPIASPNDYPYCGNTQPWFAGMYINPPYSNGLKCYLNIFATNRNDLLSSTQVLHNTISSGCTYTSPPNFLSTPLPLNTCETKTIKVTCNPYSNFTLKLNANANDDVFFTANQCCKVPSDTTACQHVPDHECGSPTDKCNMGCTSVGEHKFTIFNRDLADTNAAIHKYNPQILFFPYKKNGKQYLYNTKPVGIDSQQTSGDIKAYDATKNKYTCRIKGEYVNTATYHGGPDTWGNYQEPRLELTYYSRNNTVSCKSNVAGVEFVAGGGQYKTTCNNGTSICSDSNYRTQPLAVIWANKGCDKASYDITCSFSQTNLPAPAGGDCDGLNACGIKPDRDPSSNVGHAATGGFYRMRWDPHFSVNANDSGWHQATICCCGTDNTDCCVPTERPVIVE